EGTVQRSGNVKPHAQEMSITRKMLNSTRRSSPPLRNRRNSRAGVVHRSENAEFHAREWSTARELQNPTCGNGPPLGNRRILRAGTSQRQKITCFRALALLSYFKNLIYVHSPQKNPLKKSYL